MTMQKKNNSTETPLQRLRHEKRKLKALYEEDEKRLSEDWQYLTDNIGQLTFNSIVKGAKDSFFPSLLKSNKTPTPFDKEGGGYTLLNILSSSLPLIWEFAQPVLFKYAIRKIKSMFTSKKEDKKKK